MNEREAFIYGYMQGSSDTMMCQMEMQRFEAETAYDEWMKQLEIDPIAAASQKLLRDSRNSKKAKTKRGESLSQRGS